MIDVDFSKAYDSTEQFGKDLALRRLGFPEEALHAWQMYDDTRKMEVITAYGTTDAVHPECGAWGQGAVESPIGWLALMCWLSAYINENSTEPYTIKTKNKTAKLTKIIYADDGTYFQSSRKGAQKLMNAIDTFCAAVGIIVKPTKSYVYSNTTGTPIVSTTYGSGNNFKLGEPREIKLTELNENDFFRHLGNIQNIKGEYKLEQTEMYAGSPSDSLINKINRDVKALSSRSVSLGGTLQVLKSVIYRRILYPLTYSNASENQVQKIQQKITALIRKKAKLGAQVPSELIYTHEDMGGLGENDMESMLNIDRLMLLMHCLNYNGDMGVLGIEAVDRLQQYCKTTEPVLSTDVTHYTIPHQQMWLFQLKKWMEKTRITIQTNNDAKMDYTGIMDHCTNKQNQKKTVELGKYK